MKQTHKSPIGTSFHDTVINTTVNKLIKALGHPQYFQNDGKDKINFEWRMETENGDVFTVYDYKEYRCIGYDEIIEFHIGGHDKFVTERAFSEIDQALENTKDEWDIVIDTYKATALSHYNHFINWDEDHQPLLNFLKKYYNAPIAKPIEEKNKFEITEKTTYKSMVWTIETEGDTYFVRCTENDLYDDWQVESDSDGIIDNETELARMLIKACEFESTIDA